MQNRIKVVTGMLVVSYSKQGKRKRQNWGEKNEGEVQWNVETEDERDTEEVKETEHVRWKDRRREDVERSKKME